MVVLNCIIAGAWEALTGGGVTTVIVVLWLLSKAMGPPGRGKK